ncbi:MAG: sensor domain-containing diguanylate cyclase [Pseudomonadota bacterium]
MEGHKLLEELKRTVDALRILSEIGKTLTSTLDIKEVLRVILQKISELLSPTSWSLLMLDEREMTLKYEILINDPAVDRSKVVQLGQGIPGWAAQAAKPVLLPDLSKEKKNTPPQDILPTDPELSLICVPIRSKGKTLGVIEIRRKGNGTVPFGEEDLTTLAVIADYSAIAIENVRNFQRVQELTITDDLTSLFNVRHLHTLLETEVARAARYKKHFSMIFLDLDHFKEMNNTWGHIHGSQLLRETAQVLKKHIRSVDYGARYGGDEFVILLPETEKPAAIMVAERLRKAVEGNMFLTDKGLNVHFTASFGVATFPEDAQTKDELIRLADEAMYKVKNTTRNGVAGA